MGILSTLSCGRIYPEKGRQAGGAGFEKPPGGQRLNGFFRLVGVGMNPQSRTGLIPNADFSAHFRAETVGETSMWKPFPSMLPSDFAMAQSKFPLQRAVPILNKPVEADRGCLSHRVVFVKLVCATSHKQPSSVPCYRGCLKKQPHPLEKGTKHS